MPYSSKTCTGTNNIEEFPIIQAKTKKPDVEEAK